jgi:hypothetical protein
MLSENYVEKYGYRILSSPSIIAGEPRIRNEQTFKSLHG